jgi:uncharacterized protein YkwD
MKLQVTCLPSRWVVFLTLRLAGLLFLPAPASAQPRVDPGPDVAAPVLGATDAAYEVVDGVELKAALYVPIVFRAPSASQGARTAAVRAFQQDYLGTAGVAPAWTGSHATCTPGSTASNFRSAVLRRINYYRALAGVPAQISWDDGLSAKAQAAALLMSANGSLSHSPPSDWSCYSSGAKEAAGSSDLSLGAFGPESIDMYMRDGGGNSAVGHRRWILYPQTQRMGTGDVPRVASYASSNALWVIDSNYGQARPATRDGYVAWPPPGYIPYQIVYARWSFAYPGADFSNASVTMTSGGKGLSVALAPIANGYGENTLVWIPSGMNADAAWPKPAGDTQYTIKVSNVVVNSRARDFSYNVVIFTP